MLVYSNNLMPWKTAMNKLPNDINSFAYLVLAKKVSVRYTSLSLNPVLSMDKWPWAKRREYLHLQLTLKRIRVFLFQFAFQIPTTEINGNKNRLCSTTNNMQKVKNSFNDNIIFKV